MSRSARQHIEALPTRMKAGIGFVCGLCHHFWAMEDAKKEWCGQDCSGPIMGKAFPKYIGPLKDSMHQLCFVCGKDSDAAVVMLDGGMVGVCNAHIQIVETYSVGSERPKFVRKEKVDLVR